MHSEDGDCSNFLPAVSRPFKTVDRESPTNNVAPAQLATNKKPGKRRGKLVTKLLRPRRQGNCDEV